jgi:uncharacterized repeat protein (TIGR03943 family)
MKSFLHRFLTVGVLTVWGGVILTFFFTGRIRAYLHPTFQPFALVAGVVLIGMAVLVVLSPKTAAPHGSRSSIGSVLASLFLVAPLFLTFSKTLDRFSASTVANRVYVQDLAQLPAAQSPATAPGIVEPPLPDDGTRSANSQPANASQEDQSLLPKNKAGQVRAGVMDFLYAAQLPEVRDQLENKPVEVLGQLMPAKANNPKGNRYVIIRMIMTCCAADAQPIALPIEPQAKPELPEMAWVKVTGTAAFPVEGGQRKPVIRNATLEPIEPPEEPYLY